MLDASYYASLGLADVLDKVLAGQRLSAEDGMALFACPDITAVGALAHHARCRMHGDKTSYVVNRQINYTNVCVNGCVFCAFRRDRALGSDYFYKTDKAILRDTFRVENLPALRKTEEDFTPYEMIAFIKGALEDRVALYMDEVMTLIGSTFHVVRPSERFTTFVRDCVALGEAKGMFVRSVSDRISLA